MLTVIIVLICSCLMNLILCYELKESDKTVFRLLDVVERYDELTTEMSDLIDQKGE